MYTIDEGLISQQLVYINILFYHFFSENQGRWWIAQEPSKYKELDQLYLYARYTTYMKFVAFE